MLACCEYPCVLLSTFVSYKNQHDCVACTICLFFVYVSAMQNASSARCSPFVNCRHLCENRIRSKSQSSVVILIFKNKEGMLRVRSQVRIEPTPLWRGRFFQRVSASVSSPRMRLCVFACSLQCLRYSSKFSPRCLGCEPAVGESFSTSSPKRVPLV